MSVYEAPRIFWQTDPQKLKTDPDLLAFRKALEAETFDSVVHAELRRSQRYLDAINKLVQEDSSKPLALPPEELLALNAHFMRIVLNSAVVVAPHSAFDSRHLPLDSDGFTSEPYRIHIFGGFISGFGFLHHKKADGTREFVTGTNLVTIDARILDAVQQCGKKKLIEALCDVVAETLHEPLHNVTLTASSQHRYFLKLDREMSAQSQFARKGPPKESIAWAKAFPLTTKTSDYESWANRTHRRLSKQLKGQSFTEQLEKNAAEFFSQLREFKDAVTTRLGSTTANDMTLSLACAYTWPLHVFFAPGGPEMGRLRPYYDRLALDPLQVDSRNFVSAMRTSICSLHMDSNLHFAARALRLASFSKDPTYHSICKKLHACGRLKSPSPRSQAEVADVLDELKRLYPPLFSAKRKRKSAFVNMPEAFGMEMYDFLRRSIFNTISLRTRPEAKTFWRDYFGSLRAETQDAQTNGLLAFMREIGFWRRSSVTILAGYDVVRYNVAIETEGFFEALHNGKDIEWRPRGVIRDTTITEGAALQAYAKCLIAAKNTRHIGPAIHKATKITLAQQALYQRRENIKQGQISHEAIDS